MEKLSAFQDHLAKNNIEAALVTSTTNMFYLTDFFAAAMMIVTPSTCYYITDFRTIEDAKLHFTSEKIILEMANSNFLSFVASMIEKLAIKNLWIENRTLSIYSYEQMKAILPCSLYFLEDTIEQIRHVKFPQEIENIIKAQRICEKALEDSWNLIRPDMTEQDLVAELGYRIYKQGADGIAFPIIVLSGENTAKPHGFPSSRKFIDGDLITIDFGAKVKGYCSDMTRTFALGQVSSKIKEAYDLVYAAQIAGISAIAPGKSGHQVDAAARSIIENSIYKGTFGHGLGHSVGLICHDGMRAAENSSDIFSIGNIITMEPGIYIEGKFGIRIEDMVWLSPKGTVNLTNTPKTFLQLPL